ncbi:SusC/RagA family TonB-linked outer membrane protein [Ulvibacterium sp.]|uniref:SusC/RagA family TonB-linked outer membrane protein n=1 Tax=Ulvibacterium sp. TaxID=2665914 RepID=UPI003BACA422
MELKFSGGFFSYHVRVLLEFTMKMFFFLCCTLALALGPKSGLAQNADIAIKENRTLNVKQAFKLINKQTDYKFIYRFELIKDAPKIKIDKGIIKAGDLLARFLSPINFTYEFTEDETIVVKRKLTNNAVNNTESSPDEVIQFQVSGKVTDGQGVPLPGTNIVEKNTTNGIVTDFDGNFSIQLVDENAVIVVSYIGYSSKEVPVMGRASLNIVLEESASSLEEVVVVGYGTAKKKDLTGAVAKVNIEDTRLQPNANAAQILRGTTAGVQVTDNGRPGSNGTINIRGINSISASNAPLIVLDGIIYAGGSLSDINPGDIESIDVLKDASSTAIYGSLAANGVIEVTTKKGERGKPKITFNTYTGISDFAFIPDYLNAEEYLARRLDAEAAEGGPLPFSPIELENIEAGRSIEPFEEIKQYAPISNYELSVSGKTDAISYFFSGSYIDVKSPVRGDNFERYSGRLNLSIQITDWLKAGINSGYTSKDESGVRANLLHTAWLSPYASLFLEDGVSPTPLPQDVGLVSNPLLGNLTSERLFVTNTLFTNAFIDFDIWKGLSYKLNGGYTRTDVKDFGFERSYEPLNRPGSGYKESQEIQNMTLENIVSYNRTFAGKHRIDVTLLYGIYEFQQQGSRLSSDNIFSDVLGYNALEIGENFNVNSDARENKQTSEMARLGYSFDSKYFLTLSLRRDGFSAFGQGNKYGTFPAAAISWNVSEEPFLSNVGFLDFLKLRASWGRNGNRGVDEYTSLSDVEQNFYVFGDGASASAGLFTSSFANPDLGWETTESLNVGMDVELFSNRVSASVNYYNSNTFDLLLEQTIPNTNGFEIFFRNVGETKNWGLEIDLGTTNIKTENFTWDTNIAFSFNRNEIVKLTGRDVDGDGVEDDDIASGWFIGEPLGSNFDYVFDGIFQEGDDLSSIPGAQIGDIRFKDISGPDGVPDGIITPDDRTIVSNDQPDFIMGITNIFRYGNLSLSSTFNVRQGGFTANRAISPGANFFDIANFVDSPYWTPENPINTAPRINYRNPLDYGFYGDRSFVRLQDVSIAYDFPKRVLERIHISGLQIYVSGKNLITWTDWPGWDPEFGEGGRQPGDNGPILKTYTVGLNISL